MSSHARSQGSGGAHPLRFGDLVSPPPPPPALLLPSPRSAPPQVLLSAPLGPSSGGPASGRGSTNGDDSDTRCVLHAEGFRHQSVHVALASSTTLSPGGRDSVFRARTFWSAIVFGMTLVDCSLCVELLRLALLAFIIYLIYYVRSILFAARVSAPQPPPL